MHCTATNGGTRTSTAAPGASAASVRAVARTASAKPGTVGCGCAVVAQPVRHRRDRGAGLCRIGTAADGHNLGSKVSPPTATHPPYKLAGAVLLVVTIVAGQPALLLQFRGHFSRDRVDAAVPAGGSGRGTGRQGHLQRGRDRPGRPDRGGHGRPSDEPPAGQADPGCRSALPAPHPGQRGGRDPRDHRVRQQVRVLQFTGTPVRTTYFEQRCDRCGLGDHASSTRCSRPSRRSPSRSTRSN